MIKQFKSTNLVLLLGLFGAIASGSSAFGGTMTAGLNRTSGSLGERFLVEVVVVGSVKGDVTPPKGKGFVIEKTGTASNYSWMNGKSTVELRYTYTIYPDGPGTYQIGSFKATVDNTSLKTLPLTLTVTGSKRGGGQGQNPGGLSQKRRRSNPGRQGQRGRSGGQLTDEIFIERELSNQTPYVGEQVIAIVRIYHRGQLSGGNPKVEPTADVRRIPIEGERNYSRNFRGKRYSVIELREIVVPIRAGKIKVPPYILQARIFQPMRRGGRDLFDMLRGGNFNFGQEVQLDVASDPITINVKPLPKDGRPTNFSGLVGNFNLQTKLEKNNIEMGDSTNLTVTVAGNGLLDGLGKLPLPQLDDVGKTYVDKPKLEEKKHAHRGITTKKTYSIAIVPDKAQTIYLGDLELSTFNPKTNRYEMLRRPLGTLTVLPAKDSEKAPVLVGNPTISGRQQKDVAVVGEDLVGLHRDSNLTSHQELSGGNLIELGLFGGLPLAFLFVIMGWQWQQNQKSKLRPGERRQRSLQQLEKIVASFDGPREGSPEQAVAVLKRGFVDYFCAMKGQAYIPLTSAEMRREMEDFGVEAELCKNLGSLLDNFTKWEYARGGVTWDQVRGAAKELGQLGRQLEPQFDPSKD